MSLSALITMLAVQLFVSIITFYFMMLVLKKNQQNKQ